MVSEQQVERAGVLRERIVEFVQAFGLLEAHATPCGKPLNLLRAYLLLALYEREGGMSRSELACSINVDMREVMRVSASLEVEGYVELRSCPGSVRQRCVYLTRAGRALAAEIDGASLSQFVELLEHIPMEAQGKLVEALDVLNGAVRARGGHRRSPWGD